MRPFRCVAIGESLYDRFGNADVLGGAPVNFAVHLAALLADRARVSVLTRVGDDHLGRRLIREVESRNVLSDLIEVDAELPTGTVDVAVDADGQPTYAIARPVAWDAIEATPGAVAEIESADAVVFGTLAQREAISRRSTLALLQASSARLRVFDANIRPDFADESILTESMRLATHLKVSDAELQRVCAVAGITSAGVAAADRRSACLTLIDAFDLDAVTVTRGAAGTEHHTAQGCTAPGAVSVHAEPNADAVGAGDACLAGLVAGLLVEMDTDRAVRLANTMGAFVASRRGGTPQVPPEILGLALP
ncbi:MAG: PfkB family carbohydrate kinase [Planctomycetota bacterium]